MSVNAIGTKSKSWAPDEGLNLADLRDTGAPLFLLAPVSIGAPELITADVVDLIEETLLGLRLDYVFPEDRSVPFIGLNLELIALPFPGVRTGDPVIVTQIPDLNVDLNADCEDNTVHLRAYALADGGGVLIPAGTVLTIAVLTPKRLLTGSKPTPAESNDTTGFLTITPGYIWKKDPETRRGEAITADKLNLTALPTATPKPASIGRREIIPEELEILTAPVTSGLRFNGKVPGNITILPHQLSFFAITVTGALTTQVPVLHGGPLVWTGRVTAANTVVIVIHNLTNIAQMLAKGTAFTGRLI